MRARDADAVVVTVTAQAATDAFRVARAVAGPTRDRAIQVAAALVGGASVASRAWALDEVGIPCYSFAERAVTTLETCWASSDGAAAPRGVGEPAVDARAHI